VVTKLTDSNTGTVALILEPVIEMRFWPHVIQVRSKSKSKPLYSKSNLLIKMNIQALSVATSSERVVVDFRRFPFCLVPLHLNAQI
jgi:hypothetical protein